MTVPAPQVAPRERRLDAELCERSIEIRPALLIFGVDQIDPRSARGDGDE
jgi:hypothetical protein